MRRPNYLSRALSPKLLCVLISAVGCTVGPNYQRPKVPLPPTYTVEAKSTPGGDLGSLQWWQLFQDPALQALIRSARAKNPDVAIAAARIEQLRADAHALRASYLPQVDAQGNETSQRISPIGLPKDRTSGSPAGSAGIFGAEATWEIDFWGKYRRANEAERAALLAGDDAREAVQTTLIAEVASAYFDLLALDEQLLLNQERVTLYRSSLRLVLARKDAGVAPLQDVRSAQASVEVYEKTTARIKKEISERENKLRFLIGETQGSIPRGQSLWDEQLPDLGPGLPSALLTRRPDIREAEQNLIAANANIGIAESAYFPNISLTAAGGQESTALYNLLSGNAATYLLQPQLNLPIFTSGRIKADVQRARAEQMASLAAYKGTVIGAFRDVADALAQYDSARASEIRQQLITDQQTNATGLALKLDQAGVTSSLDSKEAKLAELAAKIQLAADREEQLSATVQLYRALGGS